jgi:hypothetical protein
MSHEYRLRLYHSIKKSNPASKHHLFNFKIEYYVKKETNQRKQIKRNKIIANRGLRLQLLARLPPPPLTTDPDPDPITPTINV